MGSAYPDLATLMQQIQQQAAPPLPPVQQQQPQQPIDILLAAAQLQNSINTAQSTPSSSTLSTPTANPLANPLALLAMSSMQPNPLLMKMLLMNMNINQMMNQQQQQQHQSDMMTSVPQPNDILAAIARSNLPIQNLMMNQHNHQQSAPAFAVPSPHMSLKRPQPPPVSAMLDRKRSCPAPQPLPPATSPPPLARSPSPPYKKYFANLTTEQKQMNEYFRTEVMRRLDDILIEEFGDPNSEKPDGDSEKNVDDSPSEIKDEASDEDKEDANSAFRRVVSKSSSIAGSHGSVDSLSKSGSTTPSAISSSPVSPTSPKSPENAFTNTDLANITAIVEKYKTRTGWVPQEGPVTEENFASKHQLLWTGNVFMKRFELTINFHFVSGRKDLFKQWMGDAEEQATIPSTRQSPIIVNKRMRLENYKETFNNNLDQQEHVCVVGVSTGDSTRDVSEHHKELKSHFVEYLANKSIIGVATCQEEGKFKPCRLHMLPPSPLTAHYLQAMAPEMLGYLNHHTVGYVVFLISALDTPILTVVPSS